jgi:hypothetical protein
MAPARHLIAAGYTRLISRPLLQSGISSALQFHNDAEEHLHMISAIATCLVIFKITSLYIIAFLLFI